MFRGIGVSDIISNEKILMYIIIHCSEFGKTLLEIILSNSEVFASIINCIDSYNLLADV